MNFLRSILLPALALAALLTAQAADERAWPPITGLTAASVVTADPATGTYTGSNGVQIVYQGMTLTAERIIVHEDTGWALADGGVQLQRRGELWYCDHVSYEFKTGRMSAGHFRARHEPFFISGDSVTADPANGLYIARNAYVTTDDVPEPFERVQTAELIIVPNKYISAHGATLYLGKVPVMYFPYYRRTLRTQGNYWESTPGYRSKYGLYALTTYHWIANTNVDGALHLDYRLRRGPGVGPDVNLHFGRWGEGAFQFYYVHDEIPGVATNGLVTENRFKVAYYHQAALTTNLFARMMVRFQNDPQFIHDFFENDYRQNTQPNSYFELNRRWANWSLDALAQPQLDHFQETVERLPDIKFTGFRQQLGRSPFYYESDSSLGWFRREFADTNAPYSAWRGDTFHQVVLPTTLFGWLNLTPRIGGRLTAYSAAQGAGGTTEEEARGVFNTGLEASFKATRLWRDWRSSFWDVDGLRHIIEPSVNYVFVPRPKPPVGALPQFDYELNNYWLLPVDYPDYNSIDSIDSQNVIRFSLWNRLQTKRAGELANLFNWGIYSDWRIQPRSNQGTFSDVCSLWDLNLRTWLTLSQQSRYDLTGRHVNELDNRLTINPGDRWSFAFGNRYLRANPAIPGDTPQNLYYAGLYYRINENWGIRTSHHYEAHLGKMQEQYYTVYRDLRSWTTALTFRVRPADNTGPSDFTVALTFSLKAFPRLKVNDDTDQPSLLLGG